MIEYMNNIYTGAQIICFIISVVIAVPAVLGFNYWFDKYIMPGWVESDPRMKWLRQIEKEEDRPLP